ncbi:hypothetical protein KGY73_03535 [bacterium]|nr:hypothetical protein [bacterium]
MKKISVLIVISLLFWSCATFSRNYKLGTEEAVNKNWDKAVEYYQKAHLNHPKNSVYRLALIRAKISASYSHLMKARNLASQGKKEEAVQEYEKAFSYDPSNRRIAQEIKELTEEKEKEEEKTLKREIEPPVKLQVREEKLDLKFHEASLRSIFMALGKHAGINIMFDQQFKDIPFTINLEGMTFEQAMHSLCLASKNFYRVIDAKTLIVVPDQPVKRAQYEIEAIKTFYLSNIKAEEIQGSLQQMLRTQYKAPTIIVDKNLNSLTIRDSPQAVELAQKVIRLWDKPKGEVVIDMEIMEVSRKRMRKLGLDFNQYIVGMRYGGTGGGGETEESGWVNMKDIDFSKAENYQFSLPSSLLQFLETDSDTKIISQPRLRGIGGEEIEYMVGDRIPIPRTTFQPMAAGGISQQPVTSFQFEDVGINVKITPRIHKEREVTLELEMEINALGGSGYAEIPIISSREVKNTLRLRDGETNILGGLLKEEERKTMKGIAGLKSIPILGDLFSNTDQTIEQTDVILTITPRIIREIPLTEEDLKPLWVNLSGISPTQKGTQKVPEEELMERMRRERRTPEKEEQAGENQVFLHPSDLSVPQGREFRVNVNLRSANEISNLSVNVNFNSQILELKEVVRGTAVRQLGEKAPFLSNIDNSSGSCTIGFSSPDVSQGYKGTGRLATLVFVSEAKGETEISLSSVTANAPSGEPVSLNRGTSQVKVK